MKRTYPQFIHTAFGVFALSLIFAFSPIAQASDITPERVVELVNQDRVSQGFQSLQVNTALTEAAQAKADDMVQGAYFAHTSPNGTTPWYWVSQYGYDYRFAGENLAIHFTDAESQEKAWMESIKHRENILNPKYRDIGVAVKHTVQNEKPTIIVVQMFGLAATAVIPAEVSKDRLSDQTVAKNTLVSSIGAVQQQPTNVPQAYASSNDSMNRASLWLQWVGFLVVLAIVSIGLTVMLTNWKTMYYKWFHKDQIFQYRG